MRKGESRPALGGAGDRGPSGQRPVHPGRGFPCGPRQRPGEGGVRFPVRRGFLPHVLFPGRCVRSRAGARLPVFRGERSGRGADAGLGAHGHDPDRSRPIRQWDGVVPESGGRRARHRALAQPARHARAPRRRRPGHPGALFLGPEDPDGASPRGKAGGERALPVRRGGPAVQAFRPQGGPAAPGRNRHAGPPVRAVLCL